MNEYIDITELFTKINLKLNLARMNDYNFEPRNYIWILGVEFDRILRNSVTWYLYPSDSNIKCNMLCGIPFIVNHQDPYTLRLCKDVEAMSK